MAGLQLSDLKSSMDNPLEVETGNPLYASLLVHQVIHTFGSVDGHVSCSRLPSVAWERWRALRRDGFILLQLCWMISSMWVRTMVLCTLSIAALGCRAGTTAHHGPSGHPQPLLRGPGVLWGEDRGFGL